MTKHQIAMIGTIPVYATEEGMFTATVNNIEVKSQTFSGIERQIAVHKEPLHVFVSSGWLQVRTYSEEEIVPVANRPDRFRDAHNGRLVDKYAQVYEYDPRLATEMKEIEQEILFLMEKHRTISMRMKPVRWDKAVKE